MEICQPDSQAPLRLGVLDSEWDDQLVGFACHGDLAPDVDTVIAMLREDQEHGPHPFDGCGDLVVERLARSHVPRRDPARDAAPLEFMNQLHRGHAIFSDMAHEEKRIDHWAARSRYVHRNLSAAASGRKNSGNEFSRPKFRCELRHPRHDKESAIECGSYATFLDSGAADVSGARRDRDRLPDRSSVIDGGWIWALPEDAHR